jgi:hypothetical protein
VGSRWLYKLQKGCTRLAAASNKVYQLDITEISSIVRLNYDITKLSSIVRLNYDITKLSSIVRLNYDITKLSSIIIVVMVMSTSLTIQDISVIS